MPPLRGKTALVTGASRGIGLAIARALARAGVRLALLSRTRPPADLRGKFISCDLAEAEQISAAVAQATDRLGRIDFVINNAGIFLEKPVPEIALADWEKILHVNLTAPFLICHAVLPAMIKRRQGRIINIASVASLQSYLHQSAYSASKHGLLGFARGLAIEARPYNVHVHTLCPGGVETDLIKGTSLGKRLRGQPMIKAEDIAETVLFLLRQPDHIDLPEIAIRRFA